MPAPHTLPAASMHACLPACCVLAPGELKCFMEQQSQLRTVAAHVSVHGAAVLHPELMAVIRAQNNAIELKMNSEGGRIVSPRSGPSSLLPLQQFQALEAAVATTRCVHACHGHCVFMAWATRTQSHTAHI